MDQWLFINRYDYANFYCTYILLAWCLRHNALWLIVRVWWVKNCKSLDLLDHTKLICGNWNGRWLDGRQSACILRAQVRNSVALQVVHHWKCRYRAGGLHHGFNKACFLSPPWDAKSFTHNAAPGFYSRTLWLVVYICRFGSGLFPLSGWSQITTRHLLCFSVNADAHVWVAF